jgi:adenine-specific DNA methylase
MDRDNTDNVRREGGRIFRTKKGNMKYRIYALETNSKERNAEYLIFICSLFYDAFSVTHTV